MTTDDLHTGDRALENGIWSPFRSLLLAQVISAALGFVFWVLVARLVEAPEVGVAASAISLQTLLGIVAGMGLGTMFIAELPLHEPGRQRRLLLRGLLVVLVTGLVLAVIVLLARPFLGANLGEALGNPLGAGTFVLGVVAAGWGLVCDDSCLAVRRPEVQVGRNLLASGLRFPLTTLMLVLGFTEAPVLQLCWVLPLLISVPVALWRLRLPRGDRTSPSVWSDLRTYAGSAMRNHALSLSLSAGTLLVPVVAGVTLTAVQNAQFAIAWLMATFVFLPPYLLSTALFAHGANVSTEEFKKSMERTIPAALLLSATLCVGAWALGEPALLIFGGEYPVKSWKILALLVPAGLWMVFKDHLVALWRSQRRFGLATKLAGVAVLFELTGALSGALLFGSVGLCLGWLSAMLVQVVLSVPWLRQAFAGLRWTMPKLSRTQAGRIAPHLASAVAVIVAFAAIGLWSANVRFGDGASDQPGGTDSSSDRSGAGSGESSSDPGATSSGLPVADSCGRSAEHRGPAVDLAVQPSRGDQLPRMLSTQQVQDLVDLAKDAGATVISTSASFRAMQPTADSAYRFGGLDKVLAAARTDGLTVKLRLLAMPTWALDDPSAGPRQAPRSEAELDRWATFVDTVVRHAGDTVGYVEVWTEPNSQRYWPTGPDPVEFARLLQTTYTAVKAIDPDLLVVSGGLRGNDIGYLEALYDGIEAIEATSTPFDVLGVEPFNAGAPPTQDNPGDVYDQQPFGPVDNNFVGFDRLHQVMLDNGDDLPVYLTLFGYSTQATDNGPGVPDEVRATYLSDAFAEAACFGYVDALSWYAFHPNPWDPPSWALLDAQNQPNLTYRALVDWSGSGPPPTPAG